MATLTIPSAQGSISLEVEDGYLLAPEEDSSILGGERSIDLFERFDGNVSDAADFVLDLVNKGAPQE